MQFKILHKGVPIGEVDLDLSRDPAVGIVNPTAAYESIRERVREATKAFSATAFGSSCDVSSTSNALSDGAALGRELELRDELGDLVKVDFAELADWESKPLDITVWVRARSAHAGTRAFDSGPRRSDPSQVKA